MKASASGLALCGLISLFNCASAQSVEDFYKGKTLSFIVSSAPGGSYDLMSRTVSRFLPKYVPGQPAIVVRNQPGAGGITAANTLFTTAPRDGTTIGGLQGNIPFEPMLGVKEATFHPRKFNWLGSPSTETCVLTMWTDSGATSLKALQSQEFTVASTGVNANPSVAARLVNQLFDTKMRPVVGYGGLAVSLHAIEKREVDGHACVLWSALQALKPAWIADKKVTIALQWGATKEPDLQDVPFAMDLITKPDDRLLLEAASAPLVLGRPFLLPPGVQQDRVAAMQRAMLAVFADKEFVDEAKKQQLDVNAPRSGPEIAALISRVYEMDPEVIARLRRLSIQ